MVWYGIASYVLQMANGNYELPRGALTLFDSIVHCVPYSVFSFGQEQGFSFPHYGPIKSVLIGFHIIWHSAAFASANNIRILNFFFLSENLFYYKQNRFHSLLTGSRACTLYDPFDSLVMCVRSIKI